MHEGDRTWRILLNSFPAVEPPYILVNRILVPEHVPLVAEIVTKGAYLGTLIRLF
jgi:hypothetical protein